MPKDDDLLPKKKTSVSRPGKKASSSASVSTQMRTLMRITRGVGILLGGIISLTGMMALIGLITDNFLIRLLGGLVILVFVPGFIADRFLKRTGLGGGLPMVGDIFAIVLLGFAMFLIAADFITRPLLTREGDRYARGGSRGMARVVYFFAGVSPTYPEEKGTAPAGSTSASGSASAAASGSAPR